MTNGRTRQSAKRIGRGGASVASQENKQLVSLPPPTPRFLLLFEFADSGSAFSLLLFFFLDYCTGNLGQGVVKHKRGKRKNKS